MESLERLKGRMRHSSAHTREGNIAAKNTVTFALVTRVQSIETPFLNEFLSYYFYLGIDRVYMVVTDPEELESISPHIAPEYQSSVTLIGNTSKLPLNAAQEIALDRISETFTLNIDMDEFLYVNGENLAEFVSRHSPGLGSQYHGFIFYWVMTPCYKHLHKASIKEILADEYFFPANTFKTMALTSSIATIGNHKFQYADTIQLREMGPVRDGTFIFHVSSRGVYDIINKTVHGAKKSVNAKEELHKLLFDPSSKRMPDRFLNLAMQSRFRSHCIDIDYNFPDLPYQSESHLLEEITLSGLGGLLGKQVDRSDIRAVRDKIADYPVPAGLVDDCAAGKIAFKAAIKVLKWGTLAFVIVLMRRAVSAPKRFVKWSFPSLFSPSLSTEGEIRRYGATIVKRTNDRI